MCKGPIAKMNHLPLFEFIFNQSYDMQLTQDVVALLERPPASPGELYAGVLILDARGLAVFRWPPARSSHHFGKYVPDNIFFGL